MKAVIKKVIKKPLELYRWLRAIKDRVFDPKAEYKVKFWTRLKYALKGFTVNEIVWYDLAHNDYNDYISETDRVRSKAINGEYSFILNDRFVFEELFGKYAKVPINYAYIKDGIIYSLHDYNIDNDNVLEFLKKIKKCVLKWNDSVCGAGTCVIEYSDNSFFVNMKKEEEKKVIELFGRNDRNKGAVLCEFISQGEFPASLYPYTANTMRIVVAKKNNEKYFHIIKAVQRIGCKASIPVDNAGSGGLVCQIDVETGTLGTGIARLGKMENRMIPLNNHPDTGVQLEGRVVPKWEKIKEEIIELSNRFPYLNFVAWDILLTEDGFCIIEGNTSSGCGIFQMSHGVKNEELGEIYRSYGIF